MSPITNPALVPPGGLGGTSAVDPAGRPAGAPGATRRQPGAGGSGSGPSFANELARAGRPAGAGDVQFSKHALARVQRRGIELDRGTLGRLSQGVDRAASKGSRDSLVLVDGTAFVVSVNNRTVITAVGSEHMKDNVFTNIDSAVIA
jgi:flagellar operon protein